MNDPRRPGRFSPPLPGSGTAGPQGPPYPPPADPAYADQTWPYAPTYGAQIPQWAPSLNDTAELPSYWRRELPPSGEAPPESPPPPGGPKSPRWLWFAAGAAVLVVVALVIALVVANDAIRTQTAVPPLPGMPGSSETPSMPTPPTRTSPSRTLRPVPPPSASLTPPETSVPGAMQDVVYTVSGDGRAISIVYIGTGDVVQTEFNVALPWSKRVSLSKSAAHPANVTVVNFGHDVTCSVTVAGVQVTQRVGVGLTVCDTRG